MKPYSGFLVIFMVLFMGIFMVLNPRETVQAASDGIRLWAMIVLPALFPFFIIAELLVELRFTNFLGVILEPYMRPLFGLPGCSALVVVMGFTSGFPIGAVLTHKLYKENLLTQHEAERLVSFTNNSSPLFIIGAVGIGMFTSASVGYILAISHYASNLCVGLFWGRITPSSRPVGSTQKKLFKKAILSLKEVPSKSMGVIMSESIKNSLNHILAVGGFIVLFSVLSRVLITCGVMDILAAFLQVLLKAFHVSSQFSFGLSTGLLEITLGSKAIAAAADADLQSKLIGISAILGLSGFSVIAQVMSIVSEIPVRFSFYLKSRCLQLFLSAVFTFILCKTFFSETLPAIANGSGFHRILYSFNAWQISLYCLLASLIFICILILISLAVNR